ncbi:MAG: hypothetical protein ACRDKT_15245 [Actinomycetota bacterium]
MRVRLSALMLAALAGSALFVVTAPAAHAAFNFAQEDADDEGEITETDEEQAETGTGGGETTEEEGPPWTYQMSWMGLVLMVIIGAMIGLMYYRMIVRRQKEGL